MKMMRYVGIFLAFVGVAFAGMLLMAPSEVAFQVNEDINAPISEVYDAITNHNKMAKWINGVESTKQTKGDGCAIGSEYDLFFQGDGGMVLNHKVNTAETNKMYAYTGTVKDFFKMTSVTEFEALDSATTRIQSKVTMEPLSNKFKLFMYAKDTHIKNAKDNYTRLQDFLAKN